MSFNRYLIAMVLLSTAASADDVRYAGFPQSQEVLKEWSAYTKMERNGCALPVALMTSSGGFQLSRAEIDRVNGYIVRAVSAWTNAIDENPFWKCQNAFVSFGPQPNETKVIVYPYPIRCFAVVDRGEIHIGRDIVDGSNAYAERIVLHEMGHMFGLADTYSEPGYQQPIGQPQGVMNNLYAVGSLTSDDIAGANALYDFINGRGAFCAGEYGPGGYAENKNGTIFCVNR